MTDSGSRFQSSTLRKRALLGLAALPIAYLLLLIPEGAPPQPSVVHGTPFEWRSDSLWHALEISFRKSRELGCDAADDVAEGAAEGIRLQLDSLGAGSADGSDPANPIFRRILGDVFQMASHVAACPKHLPTLAEVATHVRRVSKIQSRQWNMSDLAARQTLYRLLYGSRSALEEALLQGVASDANDFSALVAGFDEPSQTPSAVVQGVRVHSGDILVSRGGAAASALIARGSDYPGNFSHVALVHVNEKTSIPTIVEAHIERGVALASVGEYLTDKKLRIMVLRVRSDLPAVVADPLLPHKAATYALEEARRRHIPYDFAMNWREPSLKFCSEVAYDAYHEQGLSLWMGMSTISRQGLLNWLSLIGVRYFETHEPSDLEYDPQLSVVAEWRDLETLRMDQIDNAIIDAKLELADAGAPLPYDTFMLPPTRLAKLYSVVLNLLGGVGPVPEGMSSATALRVQRFSDRHESLRGDMHDRAAAFVAEYGYHPPYWRLFDEAREAVRQPN